MPNARSKVLHYSSRDNVAAYLRLISIVMRMGEPVSPRGKPTIEMPAPTDCTINARFPLIDPPGRKLSHGFAFAEALWILEGRNDVEPLAKYAPSMREFSNDGVTLDGAYGPRIKEQIEYVVRTLHENPDTRQAGLTIWTPNPRKSKDIPCTVSLWFYIRGGKLKTVAFMRSSDLWLGLPYDLFSFSCVAHSVCGRYNHRLPVTADPIYPGQTCIIAGSSHIYSTDIEKVTSMLAEATRYVYDRSPVDEIKLPVSCYEDLNGMTDFLKNGPPEISSETE